MVSEVGHGESVFGLAAWCLALAVAASSRAPKV